MVQRVLLTVIVSIVLSTVAVALIARSHPPENANKNLENKTASFQADVSYWQQKIRTVGAENAYKEFAQSMLSLRILEKHSAAHAFGTALYRTVGIDGYRVCGEEFGEGCLHAFFSLAFEEYGLKTALSKFKTLCAQETNSADESTCEHGIGHGVMHFLGYTTDSLSKALAICDTVRHADFTVGCAGGAYMEYNLRLASRGDGLETRELTQENRYHPCDELSSRDACMYWQPIWWYIAMERNPDANVFDIAIKMGAFCTHFSTSSPSTARACFGGIGYTVPRMTNAENELSARLCGAVSKNADDRLECWKYTKPQLQLGMQDPTALVCVGLSTSETPRCSDAIARMR